MEFAWLFKARRFFPLFVLLYTIHFPFQRSFCQRFHGLACSQSSRCLHYTYGFPWFAEDQKSHGVWFHQGSCPIVSCGSRFWWFCSTAYFSALIPWDVFFSDMMSPSLLMVPVLIDADWLILFWWVGIILSWSISSTNDDSDPKLGTVSHYFPLAWDHDSKWMYCDVFALTGGWEFQLSGMLNARGHPLVNFNMFHKDYTISWPSRTIFRRGLEFLSYTCGDVFESRSSCFSQLLLMCSFQGPLSR